MTTEYPFIRYINSDVRTHKPPQQDTPGRPTGPSEEYPLQASGCTRRGDDRRKDNGTPAQPQTQAMGAALSERQLG